MWRCRILPCARSRVVVYMRGSSLDRQMDVPRTWRLSLSLFHDRHGTPPISPHAFRFTRRSLPPSAASAISEASQQQHAKLAPTTPIRDEDQRTQQGTEAIKITRVGMYVNFGMALSKGLLGVISHSNALIADALHSLSDLLSDFVTLWTVRVARLPPDPKHPYGYGKYEAVGSLSVGAILVFVGGGMGLDGLHCLHDIWMGVANAGFPDISLPFMPTLDRTTQLGLAAGAAALSIAAKEALYQVTVRIGNRANSKVLVANAWHHRSDAISSIVALGGIVGTIMGVPLLDPAAAIAVSGLIVKTGADICLDSVRELTDKSVEAEVLDLLNEVSRGVEDVKSVSNIRARRMGPYTLVDLRVHIDGRRSISMAQQIAHRVRSHILEEVRDVSEVLVHIDVDFGQQNFSNSDANCSFESEMRPYREIRGDVCSALEKIPEIVAMTHINTHWVPFRDGNGTVIDAVIVVDPNLKVGDAHDVAKRARRAIEAIPYVIEADIHLELQDSDRDMQLPTYIEQHVRKETDATTSQHTSQQ